MDFVLTLLFLSMLYPSLFNVNKPCLCPMWEGSSRGTSREAWGISRSPRENSLSRLKKAWCWALGPWQFGSFGCG
jgi:hypothetical protein